MRRRWTRCVFITLIVSFPLMMAFTTARVPDRTPPGIELAPALLAVETLVIVGLTFARRERRRWLASLEAAHQTPSRPSSARSGPRVVIPSPSFRIVER